MLGSLSDQWQRVRDFDSILNSEIKSFFHPVVICLTRSLNAASIPSEAAEEGSDA
jgi:hypothetical protein